MLIDRLLIRAAEKAPEKVLLIHGPRRSSYGTVLGRSTALASSLFDLGLRRGDRVIIALENCEEYLISYFGALQAGCAAVAINSRTKPKKFLRIVVDCGPKAVIASRAFIREVGGIGPLPPSRYIITGSNLGGADGNAVSSFNECLKNGGKAPSFARSETDLAAIMYTSGTTGESKGVMLSHKNLSANTHSIISYLGLTDTDRAMVVLPFYYSYGNSLLLTHVAKGGSLVVENSFMYPNTVLENMKGEEATGFAGVSSTFAILCLRSNFRHMSFPALRYITQAGGHMPHSVAEEILKVVPNVKFYIMYGQTEASARLSYLHPDDLLKKHGSIGKAIPGVTLDVLNDKGEPVRPGEEGEIVASGENIMMGYWGNPEETAKVFRGGKLWTGDIAVVDKERYIYIVARKKDMIKSGAHRIAPQEIEDAIKEHPSVFDATVVGKPDEVLGESICAFVVPREGFSVTEEEILRCCRENLPLYKMPRHVYFTSTLPRTESGKIRKEELRKILSSEVKQ